MRSSPTHSLAYRADIDGLRAIAVLSVVCYHLGFRHMGGGFVGVDVFFVISGFLITSILHREISSGNFSSVRFYKRRIRRIFPALTVMLIATSAILWFVLLPAEYEDYAKSLLAATLSGSNLLFWKQTGYFATPSEMKPLLHTWSLGVEEQFYLAFPLLMLLLRRWSSQSGLRIWVVLLASSSFALSAWAVYKVPGHAFFLLDSRAWELMTGSMLAFGIVPVPRSVLTRNAVSILGLGLVLWAVLAFNASTPFPGVAALMPCVGSALLIAAGQTGPSAAGKLLSWRPFTAIGAISYSLYLWHWPILIFSKLGILVSSGWERRHVAAVLLVYIFLAAILSWRFVEVPFRSGPFLERSSTVFAFAGLSTGLLALFALAVLKTGGAAGRYTPDEARVASFLAYGGDVRAEREGTCLIDRTDGFRSFDRQHCLAHTPSHRSYLLTGDSHAAHLWTGFAAVFPSVDILQATATTCKPLLHDPENQGEYCKALQSFVFREYLPSHPVDGVILSGAWRVSDMPALEDTLVYLKTLGLKVILVGPNPSYDDALPRLLVLSMRRNDPGLPARHLGREAWHLDASMRELAQREAVRYISIVQAMCLDGAKCSEYAEPLVPMECDGNHFTAAGSLFVMRRVLQSEDIFSP